MIWDGQDRRTNGKKDHDLLIRIDVNLANFMKEFTDHALDDKENFSRLYARTGNTQKYIWMALGVVAAFEFGFKIWEIYR